MTSAADELHRSQGTQEKHRRDAKGVDCKPPDREDRVVARSCAGRDLCHDLSQALVERGLAFVALTNHRGFGVLSLEIRIRAGRAEGVVGEAGRHEQETGQEDRRQGHCVDHPVADARNDFEERAFTRRAGGHGLEAFSLAILKGSLRPARLVRPLGYRALLLSRSSGAVSLALPGQSPCHQGRMRCG